MRDEPLDRVEHRVEQRVLVQEVVDRVCGQPELGKDHQRRARIVRPLRECERTLHVVRRLRDADLRHGRRDADEVVAVERLKGAGVGCRHARN